MVIDIAGKQVISNESEGPFEYDYSGLLYQKKAGTSRRAYYTFDGVFLGEYPEDVLYPVSDGYYSAGPNKFQKNIASYSRMEIFWIPKSISL